MNLIGRQRGCWTTTRLAVWTKACVSLFCVNVSLSGLSLSLCLSLSLSLSTSCISVSCPFSYLRAPLSLPLPLPLPSLPLPLPLPMSPSSSPSVVCPCPLAFSCLFLCDTGRVTGTTGLSKATILTPKSACFVSRAHSCVLVTRAHTLSHTNAHNTHYRFT